MLSRPPASDQDVQQILTAVRAHASRRKRPALVVLAGLPGSGKSWVAEELRARTGAVVLESDALRRLLFPHRTYSAEESRRLFAALQAAAEALLADSASVIVDATNLAEAERAPLYDMADQQRAKLVLVQVSAPGPLIRRRLDWRVATKVSRSEADARVYERMRSRAEEMQRPHHLVDTSQDMRPALAAIVKEMTEP